jgi:putative ABC transport system permease protein
MLSRLAAYVRGLLRRDRISAEADDELRFHVEMATEANRRRGLSPTEARRVALSDLGGVTQTREAIRHVRTFWLDALRQDASYAARQLRRTPAFSCTAVVVLGLGIGVNTAIFSVVNAVFFRPVPVRAPGELVYVYEQPGPYQLQITNELDLVFFREHSSAFASVTAHAATSEPMSVDNEEEVENGEIVAANYFEVLGVAPMLGRPLRPEEDDVATAERAIVISHDLWLRRFGADWAVLGREVRLGWNEQRFVVVGVAPAGFAGLADPWAPSQFWVTRAQYSGRIAPYPTGLIGRLTPGETVSAAQPIVAGVAAQMLRERVLEFHQPKETALYPYVLRPVSDVRVPFNPQASIVPARLLTAVTIVAVIVLLIAAANIAGLLMARGISRTTELAVRRGLGAGTWRLVRQLVTEGVILALLGGAVGVGLAMLLVHVYRDVTPTQFLVPVSLDVRVLLFTFAVCLGTGLLVGLLPARQALRVDVVAALGGGNGATRVTRARLRHWILVPQVSLAVVLLLAAGVHAHALMDAEFANLGFRISDVVVLLVRTAFIPTGEVVRPGADPAADRARAEERARRNRALYDAVFDRIHTVSGIAAVAIGLPPALGGGTYPGTVITRDDFLAGRPPSPGPRLVSAVSPGFFRACGISLLRGREFDERDDTGAPRVAVISEALANRLWPGQMAIGKSLAMTRPGTPPQDSDWLEVVGIVNEVNPVLQGPDQSPKVWVAIPQDGPKGTMAVTARLPSDASAQAIQHLKDAIKSADPLVRIDSARTMKEIVGGALYERRMAAAVLSISGLVGLLLASIGLYGVISYSVEQRRPEIGVRSTLGARRGDIVALVLRDGAMVTLAGFVVGGALSVLALRLASHLAGLEASLDASTLVAVPLLIAVVIACACYLPARRAARVDPMVVLRGL